MTEAALPALHNALARVACYRFLTSAEKELQSLLAKALTQEGIRFAREVRLGGAGVIDFVLSDYRAGVEVKVAGSPLEVLAQLQRYAAVPELDVLVLATTRARLQRGIPDAIAGKPLRVLPMSGGLL